MKISPNSRYAVRILFALDAASAPMTIANLAEKTGMSFRAVESVHAVLKRYGATSGTVGARGGITLTRALSEIRLDQLFSWFDDTPDFSICCGEPADECPRMDDCPTHAAARLVSDKIQIILSQVTLEEIIRPHQRAGKKQKSYPPVSGL